MIRYICNVSFRSSASASAKQTLFYVEVTDDMLIHPGKFEFKYYASNNDLLKYTFKEQCFCNIINKLYFSCVRARIFQFVQFESVVILGGGSEAEGELIEVVEFSIPEMKDYINSQEVTSPSSFLFGITWFLLNKLEHCS